MLQLHNYLNTRLEKLPGREWRGYLPLQCTAEQTVDIPKNGKIYLNMTLSKDTVTL